MPSFSKYPYTLLPEIEPKQENKKPKAELIIYDPDPWINKLLNEYYNSQK